MGLKMNIYHDNDADPDVLKGRQIVVAGYGNQGRPQSLNLRDSGFEVSVAARPDGAGWRKALDDGFHVSDFEEAAETADVLLMLLPDEIQGDVFNRRISGRLRRGSALCFAHGFAVAFGEIEVRDQDLLLVAPKGQGRSVREAYVRGSGLPCLLAVENDVSGRAKETALALAWGLGCLRIAAFETRFHEEAVSDLFGEQAILCGGVPALVKHAFDLLVRRGFSPEVAYFECLHELKIIVDLFTRFGFSGMRDLISSTAAYGSLRYGENLISSEIDESMEDLFERIDSGEFAMDWLERARGGGGELERLRENERRLAIEQVGDRIRRMIRESENH
jgi:ketol-acid reductoisomerase